MKMSTKKKSASTSVQKSSKPEPHENGAHGEVRKDHVYPLDRVAETLRKVQALLETGHPDQALVRINALGSSADLRLKNARGVCLLRMGRVDGAVRTFRDFVLAPGGYLLRKDLPAIYEINLATALLLSGNVSGCLGILGEISDPDHPSAKRLSAFVHQWRSGLSLWQKLCWYVGTYAPTSVTVDFPPGDLS
jgi:hypothetical protein